MKLPDKPLRDGLAEAITGLIYEGKTVDVAESFNAPNAGWPRILIETISSVESGGKGCYLYNVSVTISVSDRRVNVGNSNAVDAIAEELIEIINPSQTAEYFSVEGFTIYGIELQNTFQSTNEDGNHKYTERSINLLIKLEQNG